MGDEYRDLAAFHMTRVSLWGTDGVEGEEKMGRVAHHFCTLLKAEHILHGEGVEVEFLGDLIEYYRVHIIEIDPDGDGVVFEALGEISQREIRVLH